MKYEHIKRTGDLIIASLAIVFLLPLLVSTYVLIKLESPGPALFRQKRYGKNKQPFTVYKFRSMSTAAPNNIPTNDFYNAHAYITRVGKVIRKLSIDELPQLINVIQGHMSLVGPRPVVLSETNLINEREKHGANAVKPGITGWAQVNGRDELDDILKAAMDGYYVANYCFTTDLRCIIKTATAILFTKGHSEGHEQFRRNDNEQLFFEGGDGPTAHSHLSPLDARLSTNERGETR
jgi:O-antigen biosynthesis protein WbqP